MTHRISIPATFPPEAIDLSPFSVTDGAKKEALDREESRQRDSSKSANKMQTSMLSFVSSQQVPAESKNSTLQS